jgi:tetratricopeptide (TPR) repeat protein
MPATGPDGASQNDAKLSLLFRAARTYEAANDKDQAEEIYTRILELEPSNDIAVGALVQVRKSLGKFEEVIEMLLERAGNADNGVERARVMADIGHIYASELGDRSQAMVAYTQAFCEDPETEAYADEVERLAGSDAAAWAEATTTCAEATNQEMRPEVKMHLFARLGSWYTDKAARPDLAVACFQTILGTNPHDEAALAGLCSVYEKVQQWAELAALLAHRATAAPTPRRRATSWPRPRSCSSTGWVT